MNFQISPSYFDYFKSRGLSDNTIEIFNLGFCRKDGSCSHPEFTKFVDFRFYNSVLFPIYDLYNNLISVSARSPEGKNYIHSAYTKSKHLYGLNVTHKDILEKGCVYIVEGNFDLLTLYDNGIHNAVAMLGSKLSLNQISLLSRFANKLILAADSDAAGQGCAEHFTKLAKENNIDFKILQLPSRYDPDLFVKERGASAFLSLQSQNLLERVKELK